jgi:two-component system, NarL family, nitrate/nitrite response regulator NarL
MSRSLMEPAVASGGPLIGAVRIVIADEFPIFRDGLRRLLANDQRLQIVGDTGVDGVAKIVRERQPDILLLGPRPTGSAWTDTLTELQSEAPGVRTILLAKSIDALEVTEVFENGACGIVAKDSPADVLFQSIEAVASGARWIGFARGGDNVAASVRRLDYQRRRDQSFGLTRRELEIVRAVVDGSTNKEIALRLAISQNTVKRHLLHIFDKLGASSRVELALFAAHHQLLDRV